MARAHFGIVALITSKAAAVIMMPIMGHSYKVSTLIAGLSSLLAAVRAAGVTGCSRSAEGRWRPSQTDKLWARLDGLI
jgi:hypothetical protein